MAEEEKQVKDSQESTNLGHSRLYKKRYMICFYESEDGMLLHQFNNIPEICRYMGLPLVQKNLTLINISIYKALKSKNHYTQLLDRNKPAMYVCLVDDIDDD